ncbi:hypothetical protein NF699_03855 [Sphingomonadaceae bacterium OTU29LAMAA1]|nr:hypothetical protein NF699_03855 [Sphingomonadaceae bacterium OTU29LAMAA1]
MTDAVAISAVHRRWTQGDITALRRGIGSGETLEQLATALGRDPIAVMTMMDRLRLRF